MSVKVLAAISFCDIYTERSVLDPERFQRAHRCISDKQFTQFVSPLPSLSLTLIQIKPLSESGLTTSRRLPTLFFSSLSRKSAQRSWSSTRSLSCCSCSLGRTNSSKSASTNCWTTTTARSAPTASKTAAFRTSCRLHGTTTRLSTPNYWMSFPSSTPQQRSCWPAAWGRSPRLRRTSWRQHLESWSLSCRWWKNSGCIKIFPDASSCVTVNFIFACVVFYQSWERGQPDRTVPGRIQEDTSASAGL